MKRQAARGKWELGSYPAESPRISRTSGRRAKDAHDFERERLMEGHQAGPFPGNRALDLRQKVALYLRKWVASPALSRHES